MEARGLQKGHAAGVGREVRGESARVKTSRDDVWRPCSRVFRDFGFGFRDFGFGGFRDFGFGVMVHGSGLRV